MASYLYNIPGYNGQQAGENFIEYIARSNGNVSENDALRFANHVCYGGITTEQVALLDTHTKINLYTAIANYKRGHEVDVAALQRGKEPPLLSCLNTLNQQMGLTQDFYEQQAEGYRKHFGEENKANLEKQWAESGLKTTFGGKTFEQVYSKLSAENTSMETPAAQMVTAFVINSYCDANGMKRPVLSFEKESPNSCGWQTFDAEGNCRININPVAEKFKGNFNAAIDTGMHEVKHARQHMLATAYAQGKIAQNDPNYTAAAVFHANLQTRRGYLRCDIDYDAYKDQVAEVDARYSGQAASETLEAVYGPNKKPAPIAAGPQIPAPPLRQEPPTELSFAFEHAGKVYIITIPTHMPPVTGFRFSPDAEEDHLVLIV